ncbi:hypothetical protein GCM10022248_13820 [Nonomuraea soli]
MGCPGAARAEAGTPERGARGPLTRVGSRRVTQDVRHGWAGGAGGRSPPCGVRGGAPVSQPAGEKRGALALKDHA